jgi:imidazolonepropionase-like amidohydrolase
VKIQVLALGLLLIVAAMSPALADSVVFINVNVIPMTSNTVLTARTVIVTDGKIARIGDVKSTAVPKDAIVVDGTDRFLMPGLAEMHAHVPGAASKDLNRVLRLFTANGVTLIRGMLGEPSHLELREKIDAGEILGPRLVTSGPSFNGSSVTGPAQAAAMVEEQFKAGYDFLKIHPGLSLAEFDAIARAANERGMPFAGHVPEDVSVQQALAAGIATIDHLDGYMPALVVANDDPTGGYGGFFGVYLAEFADESAIDTIAAATADKGVWNVPTETLFEQLLSAEGSQRLADRPEMKYMPPGTLENWKLAKAQTMDDPQYNAQTVARAIELRRKLIIALHRTGAGLLLGSDAPQVFNVPGFSVHRELAMMVDAGLSPFEALQTGTVYPASFLNIEDRIGTVQTGLDADLLLLDGNPLEDIANSRRVHGVMLRGRWLSRRELDRMLRTLEH